MSVDAIYKLRCRRCRTGQHEVLDHQAMCAQLELMLEDAGIGDVRRHSMSVSQRGGSLEVSSL